MDVLIGLISPMLFSELYKIMLKEVTFIGFSESIAPLGSVPCRIYKTKNALVISLMCPEMFVPTCKLKQSPKFWRWC